MSDGLYDTGYFVFSLDTELAYGHFDHFEDTNFSTDGQRERKAIETLLDILDEYNIIATWAIVGHLFYERCEECDTCPILDWKGKYRSFEEVYQTNNSLWYAADIIRTLLSRGSKHEIAFHGYTHELFDEERMSKEKAKIELDEWLRVARRKGIVPLTAIFPRDKVGHLDLFKQAGFICFRSAEKFSLLQKHKYIGSIVRTIDHILSLSTPPVSHLIIDPSGLMKHSNSLHFFRFNRKLEVLLDSLNLQNLRIRRIIKGIKRAANQKKILHIAAHPWEFTTEKDFEKLRYFLSYVSDEMTRGRIQSVGMADLTKRVMNLSRET